MHTPDLIHTNGVTIQPALAMGRISDSASEAALAHALNTGENTAVPVGPDFSWVSEERSRPLEG